MTVEERLTRLEQKVFGSSTELIYPTRENILLDYPSASIIQGLYGVPYKNSAGDWVIYYYWVDTPTNKSYPLVGTSKLKYWDMLNPLAVTGGAESVFQFKGEIYASNHTWENGKCFQKTLKSTNGKNFLPLSNKMELGEDGSFTVVGDEVYWFIRPSAYTAQGKPNRVIGLKRSTDMIAWTATQTVLIPDAQDIAENKDFYEMSVIKTGNDFFGFLMVYQKGNSGQDAEQIPPYTANEQTVSIQLCHSLDGITWRRLNNRKDFITRPAGIHQQYCSSFTDGNNVKFLVSESPARHARDSVKDIFKMVIYSIPLAELLKFK